MTREVMIDFDPWEQQPDEAPEAFQAFCVYRDQPARRSRGKVAQAVGKAESLIGRWMVRWNWVARVRLYDAHVDALARARQEKAILDFRVRAAQQARGSAQVLMLPSMAISGRIEVARAAGIDVVAMFEGVSIHDLVILAINSARILPTLQKAEGVALGVTAEHELPMAFSGDTDWLTQRIETSDELRSLAAVLIERASIEHDATPGEVSARTAEPVRDEVVLRRTDPTP